MNDSARKERETERRIQALEVMYMYVCMYVHTALYLQFEEDDDD